MKIVKILLAVLGVFVIIAGLQSLVGLAAIDNTPERLGYITGVTAFIALGGWLISLPWRKRKKDDGK